MLGLGDTNYDKFCHMGKSIDKRLAELGGKRLLEIACADEGTGALEITVEKWKEDIMKIIMDIHNNTLNIDDLKSDVVKVVEEEPLPHQQELSEAL